ncbi:MAG: MCE family protein [Actinomycetota bacterium]
MSTRLYVNMLIVLALGIGMTAWVVSNIIGTGFFNKPFVVTADFAASGGVFTNQEVTYRGVLIGKVGEMSLNDDGVDIELLIDEQWQGRIPSSVAATVQSKSAVGEQFVNLTPIDPDSEPLADGDTIAREDTSLPVDFQELLASLDRVLEDVPPDQLRNLSQNLAVALRGRGEDIATIIDSLSTLSGGFASVAEEQKRLLSNATQTGREFLRTKDEFAAALAAADDVFAGIGDEPEELSALFKANDRLAREASALLARRGDELAGGVRALADFVDYQEDIKVDIAQGLVHLPQFLHAIEDASVPWRSPDGRFFYRIRVGYVYDNVRSTWPCKYKLPEGYERYQFERAARDPITTMTCLPTPPAEEDLLIESLVAALTEWANARPELDPMTERERNEAKETLDLPASVQIPDALGHLLEDLGGTTDSNTVPTPAPTATPEASPTP